MRIKKNLVKAGQIDSCAVARAQLYDCFVRHVRWARRKSGGSVWWAARQRKAPLAAKANWLAAQSGAVKWFLWREARGERRQESSGEAFCRRRLPGSLILVIVLVLLVLLLLTLRLNLI